ALAIILFPPNGVFALIVGAVFLGAQWEWTRLCGVRTWPARSLMPALTAVIMALLWWQRDTPGLWSGLLIGGLFWWIISLLWLRIYTFAASPARENTWLKLIASLAVLVPAWLALSSIHNRDPHGHW
ncbi:hypothetical protein, partial [Acinetobacter baumannii]|uniref:hypothetical protein n=1 Tax=Acinetobacter baumannii TaxID=470 RepID=UPI001F5548C6